MIYGDGFRRVISRNDKPVPCRSCGALIFFIITQKGHLVPVDAREITIITREGETVRGHECHFVTCPEAAKWRNRP